MPMLRLFKYVLLLVGIATLVIVIARAPGVITLQLSQADYLISAPAVIMSLILLSALIGGAIWLVVWLVRLPRRHAARVAARRRRLGLAALSEGYMALSRQDFSAAKLALRRAEAGLPEDALPRLMAADLAILQGDYDAANLLLEKLAAEHPDQVQESRFRLALAQNNLSQARLALDAGLKSGDDGRWALQASFDLALREARWTQAQELIGKMARLGLISKEQSRRYKGLVFLEDLRQNASHIDATRRRAQAERALKLLPYFSPAVIMLCTALADLGDIKKAQSRLRQAWRKEPHPDLAACFTHIHKNLPLDEQGQLARKLADGQPDHPETLILRAQIAARAQRWTQSSQLIAGLAKSPAPERRVCELMAEIAVGEGDEGAARAWLSRAMTAAPDRCWHGDGIILPSWQALAPLSGRFDAVRWGLPEEPDRHPKALPDPVARTDEASTATSPPADDTIALDAFEDG